MSRYERKAVWRPSTLLYPMPAVMVSCMGASGKPNIITVAWAGTVCTDPAMVSISVREERFSHHLICESGEFVVNLPTQRLAWATDFCGVKSGRDLDKWQGAKLKPAPAAEVSVPLIEECPVNIECAVDKRIKLGSHEMFIARVLAVDVAESLIEESGRLNLAAAGLITYIHGEYWSVGKPLGHFGYSIRKKPGPRVRTTGYSAAKGADRDRGGVGR
jgi:flavin reductase (DIM6/NTAB) family NADH-FMN oxidoreductase RutF